jgi:hypothetical protein
MNQVHLFIGDDLYEITVNGHTIISIKKFLGASQTPRDLNFHDLSESIQNQILYAITE